ncbi:MAG: S46 family peptidase [Saprospiraceae bacterium]|nr:S46 family peptidase [Saprospiraceae bacterium]
MKKNTVILVTVLLLSFSHFLIAGEGMWLPHLLKTLNEKEMKLMGMKMSAEDIYSINKGSLKDAIVHFGGGCTGEMISSRGLLLTNHHCGYGYIQSHSTVQRNLLKDGFWSSNLSEEIPCIGLSATFIVRIEDVTAQMLKGIDSSMRDNQRRLLYDQNQNELLKNFKKESYQDLVIRGFYHGNQFFAFVTETYKDVRLVGTPPESIGKFGADTDNWVWPRHTGDFSLFRIYANHDNLPAEYAESNKPLVPRHFLPVSMSGVEEGDFTMVFGFPGRTNEYLTEEGVRQITEVQNPVRIKIRDEVLKIMDKYMRSEEKVKIQYSSSYAGIANAWKKWIGESQGVKFTKGLERKAKWDREFQNRVDQNQKWEKYRQLIPELDKNYRLLEPLALAKEYYAEAYQRNTQIYSCYNRIKKLSEVYEGRGEETFYKRKQEMSNQLDQLFKDMDLRIETEIFSTVTQILHGGITTELMMPYLREQILLANSDFVRFAENLIGKSQFTSVEKLNKLNALEYKDWKAAVLEDPLWKFYHELNYFINYGIQPQATVLEENISDLRRVHMAALLEVFPERKFYPDANSTLRVTYGKVEGFKPRDGVSYNAQTYLDGVLEKYVPDDYEFDVHPKLIKLYKDKDFGRYGENGKMPLAFIGSNHTTGGNSGSPAIDAHGNLIGLNFDRVWEGTMSDVNYDVSICRNIMVDARYILFVIDKFAGATHLVDEMKLVYPKKSRAKNSKIPLKKAS